jgi:hypothetical protein
MMNDDDDDDDDEGGGGDRSYQQPLQTEVVHLN